MRRVFEIANVDQYDSNDDTLEAVLEVDEDGRSHKPSNTPLYKKDNVSVSVQNIHFQHDGKEGRFPTKCMPRGGQVGLNMEDHRQEEYIQPKQKFKTFQRARQKIRSPDVKGGSGIWSTRWKIGKRHDIRELKFVRVQHR